MGLDINGLRLLLYSKKVLGVDFTRCATLGRQEIKYSSKDVERMKQLSSIVRKGSRILI